MIHDNTFYLCLKDEVHLSGDNGVYRSDDDGATWYLLTPFEKKYPNIEPRAIAVLDNTVFVGTNKGLYRLNGNTWEQIFLDEIGEKSTYLPIISMEVRDNVLYVARSYQIENSFRSYLGNKPEHLIPVHQISDDVYVEIEETPWEIEREIVRARAATDLSWALFASSDHGRTWRNITPRRDNTDKEEQSRINLLNGTTQDIEYKKRKVTNLPHKSSGYRPLKIMVTANEVMLADQKRSYHSSDSGKHGKL